MATTLSYSISAFSPYTKIISADMNTLFRTDLLNRINWAGGSSATTGLGDDNLQSNTASGGGLTRSTKLKAGTARAFIVNASDGTMTEVVPTANQTIYTDASNIPTAGTLPVLAGGTGLSVTIGSQLPGDVFQVNSTSTAMVLSQPTAVPASLKIFQFLSFS
jgi:hypothetical protein